MKTLAKKQIKQQVQKNLRLVYTPAFVKRILGVKP